MWLRMGIVVGNFFNKGYKGAGLQKREIVREWYCEGRVLYNSMYKQRSPTSTDSIAVISPPLAPLIPVTVPRIHRIADVYTLLTILLCSWCYCEYSSSVDLTIGNVLFHF
ncbi:hypothetical protein QQG55_4980 [Brugia pahangi]